MARVKVNIRKASLDDAKVIASLCGAVSREGDRKRPNVPLTRKGVRYVLTHPAVGRFFVATVNGKVVGQVYVGKYYSVNHNAWYAWLGSVYVRKEFRQHGVFRTLFSAAVRYARKDKRLKIRLMTAKNNRSAQTVYRALGFRQRDSLVFDLEL